MSEFKFRAANLAARCSIINRTDRLPCLRSDYAKTDLGRVLGGMLIALAAIIGGCVVKILKSNNQTKLKQEMIARGMSVDEIKAILEAGSKPPAIKID
jgi:hypothetical protein